MTKADLVEQAADMIGLRVTKRDYGLVVDAFLDAVKDTLARSDDIEIRGFGTAKARTARNPSNRRAGSGSTACCACLHAVEAPPQPGGSRRWLVAPLGAQAVGFVPPSVRVGRGARPRLEGRFHTAAHIPPVKGRGQEAPGQDPPGRRWPFGVDCAGRHPNGGLDPPAPGRRAPRRKPGTGGTPTPPGVEFSCYGRSCSLGFRPTGPAPPEIGVRAVLRAQQGSAASPAGGARGLAGSRPGFPAGGSVEDHVGWIVGHAGTADRQRHESRQEIT